MLRKQGPGLDGPTLDTVKYHYIHHSVEARTRTSRGILR